MKINPRLIVPVFPTDPTRRITVINSGTLRKSALLKHLYAAFALELTLLRTAFQKLPYVALAVKLRVTTIHNVQLSTGLNILSSVLSYRLNQPWSIMARYGFVHATASPATASSLNINFFHSNAESLSAHLHDLQTVVFDNQIHVLGILESFLKRTIASRLVEILGFKLFHVDQLSIDRGGVAIYVHESTL